MSKITVTTIAGQTSGGDANKVKIESGDTLEIVNGSQTINRTGNGVAQTIQNGGTTVGQIGVNSTDNMFLVSTNTGFKLLKDEAAIAPAQSGGSNHDNALDLGFSTVRWKDLYLSGGAFIGGATTANKLDDYEEGTFTPAFTQGFNSPTYQTQNGRYTKIGRVVYIETDIRLNGGSANTSHIRLGNLPFTSSSAAPYSAFYFQYNGGWHNISYPSLFLVIAGSTYASYYRSTDGGAIGGNDLSSGGTNATVRIGGWYTT